MNHIMRKPVFCICENIGTDQMCGNRAADQRPYHRKYNPSSSQFRNFKPLAIFCACTARFVSEESCIR